MIFLLLLLSSAAAWAQAIVIDSCTPKPGASGAVLTIGEPVAFSCAIRVTGAGSLRLAAILESDGSKSIQQTGIAAEGPQQVEFIRLIPAGWTVPPQLYFQLLTEDGSVVAASPRLQYSRLQTSMVDLGAVNDLVGSTVLVQKSPGSVQVRAQRSLDPIGPDVVSALADAQAAPPPDFVAMATTWRYSSSVVADGRFEADLSFRYSAAELPDDPNFDESKIAIISINAATKQFRIYPTAVDLPRRTATTRVNGFEPVYALAVIGPFRQTVLAAPLTASGWTLINPGAGLMGATVRTWSPAGELLNDQPVLLAPGQALSTATDAGWVEIRAEAGRFGGAQLFGDASAGDAVGLTTSRILTLLVGSIESGAEIQVANLSNFVSNITVELHDSSGSLVTSSAYVVGGKAKISQKSPDGFQGYALIQGSQPLSAVALNASDSELALSGGQPVKAFSKLFAAHFETGDTSTQTVLTLVHTGKKQARATVSAIDANGLLLAPAASITLDPGQQVRRDVRDLFGFVSDKVTAGSLIVEVDAAGVLGDLRFGGPGRTILALDGTPTTFAVLGPAAAGAGAFAGVAVQNTSLRVANVTVRSFRSDGRLAGAARVDVPPLGRFSDTIDKIAAGGAVDAGSYVTVEATQLVSVSGLFGRTGLDWLAALPVTRFDSVQGVNLPVTVAALPRSNTFAGLGGFSGSPAIEVSPPNLAFGNVPVGQSRDSSITVRNTGTLSLIVQGLTATNPTYTFSSVQLPLVIPPGGQQGIGIQFAPSVGATLAANLTVFSNDPQRSPVSVSASGTGTLTPPPPSVTPNPIPTLTTASPTTVFVNGPAFTLFVTGANFTSSSVVEWNGSAQPTTLIGPTQLQAAISAPLIAVTGSADITVSNPAPGGGRSSQSVRLLIVPIPTGPANGPSIRIHQIELERCPEIHLLVSALTRDGNPLDRLTGANLVCGEDNQAERCSLDPISNVDYPLAVAFVVGTNGLPDPTQVEPMKDALNAFLDQLGPSDVATIIHAGDTVSSLQNWTDNKPQLKSVFGMLRQTGSGTALFDAVNLAMTVAAQQRGKRQVVIVVTPSANTTGTIHQADTVLSAAATRGMPVFSIATGPGASNPGLNAFLQQLGVNSQGLATSGFVSDLRAQLQRYAVILQAQYFMNYFSSRPDGRPHTVNVNLQGLYGTATTSRVYSGCAR